MDLISSFFYNVIVVWIIFRLLAILGITWQPYIDNPWIVILIIWIVKIYIQPVTVILSKKE